MTSEQNIVRVRIGQFEVRNRSSDLLKATLGSCIGIAILWREKKSYALAHCLLPTCPDPNPGPGARYVDQALGSMLRGLRVQPEAYGELEVHVAGGGNMTHKAEEDFRSSHIGQLNIVAAQSCLKRLGLPIRSEDVGGRVARQILLDCSTETVSVVRLPSPLTS